MLRDFAGDVSGDTETEIDNDFFEKCASLDVKKIAAKILMLRINHLILMAK